MIKTRMPVQPLPEANRAQLAVPKTADGLRCRVIDSEAEFFALETAWRSIVDRMVAPSPLLSWPWLMAWWETLGRQCPSNGKKSRLYVVVAEHKGDPVGIFPFFEPAVPFWSLKLRRLRPMGYAGQTEPAGLSEEPMAITLPEFDETARRAVVDLLSGLVAKGRWDCAIVRHLEPDSCILDPLNNKLFGRTRMKKGPQVVLLPESWSAFRKVLTKSMRDNLSYYPRLLNRSGHNFEVRFCREPAEMASAVHWLVSLHKQRVRSEVNNGHRDYFPTDTQTQMLMRGMAALAKEGIGYVALLVVDGQTIAAQAFAEANHRLLFHYSGFDPEFGKFSPLLVLQSEVIQQAMTRGVQQLDLLYGSAQWQTRWGAQPYPQEYRATLISRRPMPLVRAGVYAATRETMLFLRRRKLAALKSRCSAAASSLCSAGMQLHIHAIRLASSPALSHHLSRVHR